MLNSKGGSIPISGLCSMAA